MTESTSARILLFTGDGKGKTTAALGMVLRAAGHGLNVFVMQFIKSNKQTGELAALRKLAGVEIIQCGRGFVPNPNEPAFAEHKAAAEKGLARAAEAIASKKFAMVVLDEVCTAIAKGLADEAQVKELVERAAPETILVLTGRNATPSLIGSADTVTEMRCVKHGFAQGRTAQRGVEL